MVYDASRAVILLHGGIDEEALADTWPYDGTTWSELATVGGPPAVSDMGLAYDAVRERIVRYGGDTGSGYSNATWELVGNTWTETPAPGAPGDHAFGALVYHHRLGEAVLFGGDEYAAFVDGTWELADSGSLNGSYVNRRRIDRQLLTGGDEVQIGKFRMIYFVSEHGLR